MFFLALLSLVAAEGSLDVSLTASEKTTLKDSNPNDPLQAKAKKTMLEFEKATAELEALSSAECKSTFEDEPISGEAFHKSSLKTLQEAVEKSQTAFSEALTAWRLPLAKKSAETAKASCDAAITEARRLKKEAEKVLGTEAQ